MRTAGIPSIRAIDIANLYTFNVFANCHFELFHPILPFPFRSRPLPFVWLVCTWQLCDAMRLPKSLRIGYYAMQGLIAFLALVYCRVFTGILYTWGLRV